jgi:hypothetical protein
LNRSVSSAAATFWAFLWWLGVSQAWSQTIVINEIMFDPVFVILLIAVGVAIMRQRSG